MFAAKVYSTSLNQLTGKSLPLCEDNTEDDAMALLYDHDNELLGIGVVTSDHTVRVLKSVLNGCFSPSIRFLWDNQVTPTLASERYGNVVIIYVSSCKQKSWYALRSSEINFLQIRYNFIENF